MKCYRYKLTEQGVQVLEADVTSIRNGTHFRVESSNKKLSKFKVTLSSDQFDCIYKLNRKYIFSNKLTIIEVKKLFLKERIELANKIKAEYDENIKLIRALQSKDEYPIYKK